MKLDGIQVGRAIAALSVLYFHSWTALVRFPPDSVHPFWPLATFGELGVDLFFGISGFVICLIADKPSFRPIEFLTRRAFRLYPLWLLCLGGVAGLFAVWRGWQNSETIGYLLYSATLLPTRELPFYSIGWTLQHEITFYFLAAVLVPAVGLFGLLCFLILSFATMWSMPWYISNLAAFHAEFAAGIVAYLLFPKLRWLGSAALIGLGLGGMCILFYFFGHRAVAPALFFAVVGFANLDAKGAIGRTIAAMGDRSYSIYLLHPLIFWSTSAASSLIITKLPWWSAEPIRFSCIAFVVYVARFSWKLVELPTIRYGNAISRRLFDQRPTTTSDKR